MNAKLSKSLCILVLFLFNASAIASQDKPCLFAGKIENQKGNMVKCSIEQAGYSPYLLYGLSAGEKFYIVDVSGVSGSKGKQDITISIMEDGNPGSRAVIKAAMNVVALDKGSPYIGFQKRLTFTTKSGEKLQMEGAFIWDSRKFKSAKPKAGTLTLELGALQLQSNNPVAIKKWNDGYRITNLFVVKPGHTANLTLDFKATAPGTYQGKETACNIMVFEMIDGKSSMRILKGSPVVKVTKENKGVILHFEGQLKDDKGSIKIKGQLE